MGKTLGWCLGAPVGMSLGWCVGAPVGMSLGWCVGAPMGGNVGSTVGIGELAGDRVGTSVPALLQGFVVSGQSNV